MSNYDNAETRSTRAKAGAGVSAPTYACCEHCIPNTVYCSIGHIGPCDTPECASAYPACCGLTWFDPDCPNCGKDSLETGNRDATSRV